MPEVVTAPADPTPTPDPAASFVQKLASTRLLVAALPLPAVASFAASLSDAKFCALVIAATVVSVAYIVANTIRPHAVAAKPPT